MPSVDKIINLPFRVPRIWLSLLELTGMKADAVPEMKRGQGTRVDDPQPYRNDFRSVGIYEDRYEIQLHLCSGNYTYWLEWHVCGPNDFIMEDKDVSDEIQEGEYKLQPITVMGLDANGIPVDGTEQEVVLILTIELADEHAITAPTNPPAPPTKPLTNVEQFNAVCKNVTMTVEEFCAKIAKEQQEKRAGKISPKHLFVRAHERSYGNVVCIAHSSQCACYCCLSRFASEAVAEYTSDDTAICPKCGIDSVLGDEKHNDNYPAQDISEEFIAAMQQEYFGDITSTTIKF